MKYLFIVLMSFSLIACGTATDIGNPEDQLLSDAASADEAAETLVPLSSYVGNYGFVETASASPMMSDDGGGSDAPISYPECVMATAGTPSVAVNSAGDLLELHNVFGYADLTDPILASVNAGNVLATATGDETTLSCGGVITTTSLSLTCTVNQDTTCELSLSKNSES